MVFMVEGAVIALVDLMVPVTSSTYVGLVVPIPTAPDAFT